MCLQQTGYSQMTAISTTSVTSTTTAALLEASLVVATTCVTSAAAKVHDLQHNTAMVSFCQTVDNCGLLACRLNIAQQVQQIHVGDQRDGSPPP